MGGTLLDFANEDAGNICVPKLKSEVTAGSCQEQLECFEKACGGEGSDDHCDDKIAKYRTDMRSLFCGVMWKELQLFGTKGGQTRQQNLGLRALCKLFLDIWIDKRQQKSNWEARPLSEAQKMYAAIDAWVLLPLVVLSAS